MVSILVLVRDAPRHVIDCIHSLLSTIEQLRAPGEFELVFIDDNSDPSKGIVDLLKNTRASTKSSVQIIRFKKHQHYGHGLAYGFAAAKGSSVLFVSHDMILTPECVTTLLELAAMNKANGVIRPLSQHMDYATQMTVNPPLPLRTMSDVREFSKLMRDRFGYECEKWPMLIGDAMLIRRDVIDAIGVPDMRFFGFMSDIDYGIRARRAGFDLLIAKGAWLHHLGQGHVKEAGLDDAQRMAILQKNVVDADKAYALFRQKWGASTPHDYRDITPDQFKAMVEKGAADGSSDYHAPPALDPAICEIH